MVSATIKDMCAEGTVAVAKLTAGRIESVGPPSNAGPPGEHATIANKQSKNNMRLRSFIFFSKSGAKIVFFSGIHKSVRNYSSLTNWKSTSNQSLSLSLVKRTSTFSGST